MTHEHGEAGKDASCLHRWHAIEALSGFEIAHGEAVGLGLRAAARISERRGLCESGLEERVVAALARLRLPLDLDGWMEGQDERGLIRAIHADKKRAKDTVSYVALESVGRPSVLALKPAEIVGLLRRGPGDC